MTEYQLLDLMYQGFIQNGMYFVAMVLLTWLGFRMAANVASDPNIAGQIFTTIFCLFVGLFFYTTNQIGGGVLSSYTAQLIEMGADSGTRLSEIANSPAAPGGALQVAFNIFIVIFQLAIIWVKR
jgi:hypothetical protein